MTNLRTVLPSRRAIVSAIPSGLLLAACAGSRSAPEKAHAREAEDREADDEDGEAEVTPGEDLMQEHGVVERLLLIYAEAAGRIERKAPLDLALVTRAADIVRRFVQDYHEKNEEQHVFPRLQAARRETDLVAVLLVQHERGRRLTDDIARLAKSGASSSGSAGSAAASDELARALRAFERMYRPHAAREDTVLFPAFRAVMGRSAYRELGEQFEEEEHARFGEHGFETTVAAVADVEKALGIADLSAFTPA